MNSRPGRQRPPQPTVLVLWCYRCDEVTTVTFVSRLRQAGVRVKLVGVDGRSSAGRAGIVIKADRMLDDVSSPHERIVCIILPFDEATLQRVADDPRVWRLWQSESPILSVTAEASLPVLHALLAHSSNHLTSSLIYSYQANNELSDFISILVNQLI